MKPLFFTPLLKQVIWGGEEVTALKGTQPAPERIGESWEISGVSGDETPVCCGPDKGMTLQQLIAKYGADLIGSENLRRYGTTFPLLIKFISAAQDLSIQVHPDDAMAQRMGHPYGKTEMWFIVRAKDDASLVAGFSHPSSADEYLSYLHSYGIYVQDNFGWRNRYYLDLGLRMDYNTAFGDQVGWQAYPKVGLSYILSDEPWMRSLQSGGWINSLKLMANYGVAGSYPPAFEYQRTIEVSSYLGKQANTFGKNGNPNLGPEKKHSYEVGFQGQFFHHVLSLGLTYYYAITRDALFNMPTLPSSGQSSTYLANVGKIRNSGIELYMGVNIIDTREWGLSVRGSLNTNSNEVLSTGGAVPFAVGGFSSRTITTVVEEGKSVGFLRGTATTLNDDGTVKETLYNQDLGRTIPTVYGNFSVSARWRDLNFTLTGDYQAGAYVHSFDRQFRYAKGIEDGAIPAAAIEGSTQAQQWLNFTNFFVEKSDFVKIRNIGIDYTWHFPKFVVNEVNVGFNIYNPFSWTSSSVDPEAVLSGARTQGAVATGGLSYSSYSLPRQYVFSARVSF